MRSLLDFGGELLEAPLEARVSNVFSKLLATRSLASVLA